jgi:CopG antitoxin of type II toxin-antitoxin system
MTIVKKKLPRLKTDAKAEAFVDKADLSEFDLSVMFELRFELGPEWDSERHPSP